LDNKGNAYITGELDAKTRFMPLTRLDTKGDRDIFVAMLDKWGLAVWGATAGGTSVDEGKAITLDQEGNIYTTGIFSGTATFGTKTVTAKGEWDIYVWKIAAGSL
jgi:hypothetical protein